MLPFLVGAIIMIMMIASSRSVPRWFARERRPHNCAQDSLIRLMPSLIGAVLASFTFTQFAKLGKGVRAYESARKRRANKPELIREQEREVDSQRWPGCRSLPQLGSAYASALIISIPAGSNLTSSFLFVRQATC